LFLSRVLRNLLKKLKMSGFTKESKEGNRSYFYPLGEKFYFYLLSKGSSFLHKQELSKFIDYFVEHLCEISPQYLPCKKKNNELRKRLILNYFYVIILPSHDIWQLSYEGKIAGFAVVLRNTQSSCLTYLYVDKAYRGRGLGSSIIKVLKKHYGNLHLYVEEDRKEELVPFYEKVGFKVVDSELRSGVKYLKLTNWD